MNKGSKTINMVLTSLVNNESLYKDLVLDIESRFKTKIDPNKLKNFLETVEVDTKDIINLF